MIRNVSHGLLLRCSLVFFLMPSVISALPDVISAQSDEKMQFSLKTARKYAMENNYDVRNSKLEISAAKKQLQEVASSGFPQINGSVEYSNFIDIPTQLIPGEITGDEPGSSIPVKFGKPHNATLGVSASQLIFSSSFIVGVQASKIYLKLTEQNLERSQLDVAETVTETYCLICVAEENRRILEERQRNFEKAHYEVQERFHEGFLEETDVKQLQISLTRLKNTIATVERQIDITHKLLKFQMGIDFNEEISLIDDLEDILKEVNVSSLMDREFEPRKNVNLRLLLSQERLAKLSLRHEWSKFLPTISGFASYQRSAQRDRFNLFERDKDWFPTTVIGLRIDIPIFSSGDKLFSVQRAKIALEQARNAKLKAEQGLLLEFSRARIGLASAYENYKNTMENMDLSGEVFDITLEKYNEGLSSSLDLIQSHNQYLLAQSEYIIALSELLNAKNLIDKLLGNY